MKNKTNKDTSKAKQKTLLSQWEPILEKNCIEDKYLKIVQQTFPDKKLSIKHPNRNEL